jgi:hypothetical protein
VFGCSPASCGAHSLSRVGDVHHVHKNCTAMFTHVFGQTPGTQPTQLNVV